MKSIEHLFCKSVSAMVPYSPIEPPDQIAKRLGLNEEEIIKLDANENPFGTSERIKAALSKSRYYHIYPDPAQVQLREAIAGYAGFDPDCIIAGTGADEIIDLVCRLLLEPGDEVLSFTPTFSYYSHVIALNKGKFQAIPRAHDFSINLTDVTKIDLTRCKLVILCSPNNPSGNLLEEAVLDYFLSKNVIVMVDEAYYEFSEVSFKEKIKTHQNLIILRTFSKCFALAGLRVGYGIGSRQLIAPLMKIKPPFSVNIAAEVALKCCLSELSYYKEQVNQLREIRDWTQDRLGKFKQLEVFPSQSNFILSRVKGHPAGTLCQKLERQGILLRYFATDRLKDCFRVSIGTQKQMEIFIQRLGTLIH